MTGYRRFRRVGSAYFFTVVTAGRRPLLIEHVERLRSAFARTRERHPFAVEAIVVLPDHLHTIWRLPDGDADFSMRWRVLKRLFSSAVYVRRSDRQAERRERGVWQRRFWEHCIRDEADWRRHLDYIHYNPVKHRYCARPADWKYGSFARLVARGWYAPEWGGTPGDRVPMPDWAE